MQRLTRESKPAPDWRQGRHKLSTKSARRLATIFAMALITAAIAAPSALATPPEATTEAATGITTTSATLNATIATGGFATLAGFEYGEVEESGEGTQSETIPAGKGTIKFSQEVTGLTPNTTYYFRVGAYGNNNFDAGEILSFKTDPMLGLYFGWKDAEGPNSLRAYEYPASVVGDQVTPVKFKVGSAEAVCTTAHFEATMGSLAEILPLDAAFEGCEFGPFGNTTIKMNSCHLDVQATYWLSKVAGISCETPGDQVELVAAGCTVKVPPQAPSGFGSFTNYGEGNGSTVSVFFSRNIEYTKKGFSCFLISGTGSLSGSIELGVE